MQGLRARLRRFYEDDAPWARRARDALLAFDVGVLLFVVATSFVPAAAWVETVDTVLGLLLLTEFAARLFASRTLRRDLLHPWTWVDAVAIASFLAPVAGEALGFLRALRLVRVLRLFRVLDRLREVSQVFRRNEEAIIAGTNLLVFIFVMTGLVYTTQHRSNPQIAHYADALYFTIVTMATVGYGDVHAEGQVARALVIGLIVFDVVIVASLVRVIPQLRRERRRE